MMMMTLYISICIYLYINIFISGINMVDVNDDDDLSSDDGTDVPEDNGSSDGEDSPTKGKHMYVYVCGINMHMVCIYVFIYMGAVMGRIVPRKVNICI
jgi:hypothetical protein